jgi:subtilisin family serine protease
MRIGVWRGRAVVLGLASVLALGTRTASAGHDGKLIIACQGSCDPVVSQVQALGGEVRRHLRIVDAVAVTVPQQALPELTRLGRRMYKDVLVEPPAPVTALGNRLNAGHGIDAIEADDVHVLDVATLAGSISALPANYNYNNNLTGASALHTQGKLGQDVVVAVIDTGTTNAPVVPVLSGTVIGGETFVVGDPVASATSRLNNRHGTWVGCMIAAHGAFIFLNTSTFIQSLLTHSPESVIPCPNPAFGPACIAGRSVVPMIGTAPGAKIYALKVFNSAGGGASTSTIIAAMERAITLRRNFNAGVPSVPVAGDGSENNPFVFDSLNIQVVNMSLGGPTVFAARDLEDKLTEEMLKAGITIVVSAGNDGFAAMTGGSPGTGRGALTVGAANTPVHLKVLLDVLGGLGFGDQFRANDHIQTADFSSRGPTADGRFDPDVIANGYASYAQAASTTNPNNISISFVSGTSFSGPTTAGAAALLRGEVPSAKAVQIRNALVATANPHLVGDDSRRIDQGRGFIDIPAALARLQTGWVTSSLPRGLGSPSVLVNLLILGFRPVIFLHDRFEGRVDDLKPGEVAQFFLLSQEKTDRFVVKLRNVTPELPPAQQNPLFGDDLVVHPVDAPTSFARNLLDPALPSYPYAFVNADADFPIDNPQVGLVRVAIQGDWTNAGRISADLIIERERGKLGRPTASGRLRQDDLVPVTVDIPSGTAQVVFETFWDNGWEAYPTSDLDLFLVDPDGNVNSAGATLDSPERVVVNAPTAGTWTAFIQGFTVHRRHENFRLFVTADGVRLP